MVTFPLTGNIPDFEDIKPRVNFYGHKSMNDAVNRYLDHFGNVDNLQLLNLSEGRETRGMFISLIDKAILFDTLLEYDVIKTELYPDIPDDADF